MKKIFTSFLILISFFSFSQVLNFQWAKDTPGGIFPGGGAIYDMTTDALGNVYFTGYFAGTQNFDPGPWPAQYYMTVSTPSNNTDIFVVKLDPSGNFVWAQQIDLAELEWPLDISVDAVGNVAITGIGYPPSFPTRQIAVAKLNSSGTILWQYLITKPILTPFRGGFGHGIYLDPSGDVYFTGEFMDTIDVDSGIGTTLLTYLGPTFGWGTPFVIKYNSSGTLAWAGSIDGGKPGNSTVSDNLGNVYFSGQFTGTVDLDIGPSTFTLNSPNLDNYILKMTSGGSFVWAKQLVGLSAGSTPTTTLVRVDNSNNLYYFGAFTGTIDIDPGLTTYTINASPSGAYFAAKLDVAGNFQWVNVLTNSSFTVVAPYVDKAGNTYITGNFSGTQDFDPGPSTYTLTSAGSSDIFVLKLDANGNFVYALTMGDASPNSGISISTDNINNLYLWVDANSQFDLDPSPGVFTGVPVMSTHVILKLGQSPLGVNIAEKNNQINISPNPTSGQFNLIFEKQKEKTEIKIFNSLGQLVLQKTISSADKISLSISDQPSGIYFVEVIADGESYRAKVVKE